jgi:shikimate 5-dehydrogenase
MPHTLIGPNPDLKQLWDEGLEIEIRNGILLVHHIPYVNAAKEIKFGTLVSELALDKDRTVRPSTHTAHWIGEHPCHKDGSVIAQIRNSSQRKDLGDGIVVDHMFSNKPEAGYADYHHKITTYIQIISSEAQSIDAIVTAYTFQVIPNNDGESVFRYVNTNSSEAEINAVSSKLRGQTVAIIGLGGTGSYILDLVSKTEVKEIRLFDRDTFIQRNAFRAPGATPIEKLGERIKKTDYFKAIYSQMHTKIVSDPVNIDSSNMEKISDVDFVFICIDDGKAKKPIVEKLLAQGTPFIDVGIDVMIVDGANMLIGVISTTTGTPDKHDHIEKRISFAADANDLYARNIQIAELNALNATLAVIKWKKVCGFYQDLTKEHNTTYTINTGEIENNDVNA